MIKINPINIRTGYKFPEEAVGRRIYLHGEAQDINEYDCCGILKDNFPEEEGIYPCEIMGIEGPATLFLWFDKEQNWKEYKFENLKQENYYLHGPGRFMGLIILDRDIASYKDAKEKFEGRTPNF